MLGQRLRQLGSYSIGGPPPMCWKCQWALASDHSQDQGFDQAMGMYALRFREILLTEVLPLFATQMPDSS